MINLEAPTPDPAGTLKLELISCTPTSDARETPVLFIHGAFGGAWCWAEHFLAYFARNGYAAHALSLRGHGASDGHERLRWTSLSQYVDDVQQAVANLGVAPVIVGHSMGGMVLQKYLERASVPAAVLMASVPPDGLIYSSMWLAARDPLLYREMSLMQIGGPYFGTLDGGRRAIFSPDMPDALVARYYSRFQQESQRVLIDMCWFDLPRRQSMRRPPALVLGAECDALLPRVALESTARSFDTEAVVMPNMAHALMLELNWRLVADRVLAWLDEFKL